jgi:hypothetical protein
LWFSIVLWFQFSIGQVHTNKVWSAEVHVNFTLRDHYELRLQEREQMRFQGRQCAKSRVLTRISAPPEAVAESCTWILVMSWTMGLTVRKALSEISFHSTKAARNLTCRIKPKGGAFPKYCLGWAGDRRVRPHGVGLHVLGISSSQHSFGTSEVGIAVGDVIRSQILP